MKQGLLYLCLMLGGCSVSTSMFIEKDWRTDEFYTSPDCRTRIQIEAKRDFNAPPN